MVIFSETKENTNLAEVHKVETELNLKFPAEYVDHILLHNGGVCTPDVFAFKEKGKITNSSVNKFLAIHDGKYSNLRSYINIYKTEHKRLPANILPIANDPGGNLICMSCGEKDYGCIYFWDHENEVDYNKSGDGDYSNLFLIANSFNEFIDGLKE